MYLRVRRVAIRRQPRMSAGWRTVPCLHRPVGHLTATVGDTPRVNSALSISRHSDPNVKSGTATIFVYGTESNILYRLTEMYDYVGELYEGKGIR